MTQRIQAYEKRRLVGQELLGIVPLELPPQIFETVGMWLEIPDAVKEAVVEAKLHFMGGIHALEHALISMFPLFALADRYDIGGISHPLHPQLQQAAVFIYDGYPGGVGLAARGYEMTEPLLIKTRELIASCGCEDGCPSCIHSPKCGAGNKPLDKAAALMVAEMLLGLPAPAENRAQAGNASVPDRDDREAGTYLLFALGRNLPGGGLGYRNPIIGRGSGRLAQVSSDASVGGGGGRSGGATL